MSLFQSYIPLIQEKNWFRIIYLFGGNIVWFIPLGMYLQWFKSKRSLWEIVVFGFLFSFFIETMQYILSSGVSELDDLILNTIGAVAFKNAVDMMFDRLEQKAPEHFAVRQYKKYKLAAGVINCKRLLNQNKYKRATA